MSFEEELAQLREEYNRIDRSNPENLKRWLISTQYLGQQIQCLIANRSRWTILDWRRKLGLSKKFKQPPNKKKRKSTLKVELLPLYVPPDWKTNREWLIRTLQTYSVYQLSKLIPSSMEVLYNIFKEQNIPHKSHKESLASTHPKCTYSWCYKHYVSLGLTTAECARLASISRTTFMIWLTKFNIPIISSIERLYNNKTIPPLWVRNLCAELNKQSIIDKVRQRPGRIYVLYRTKRWEEYWYDQKTFAQFSYAIAPQTRLTNVPKVLHEYKGDFSNTNPYPSHYIITRSSWNRANIVERRIAIHKLMHKLWTKWEWPTYPDDVLQKDLKLVCGTNPAHCLQKDIFNVYPQPLRNHSRRILLHYFGVKELYRKARYKPCLHAAILAVTKKRLHINTSNIYMQISKKWGPMLYNPIIHVQLFRTLKVTGPVFDINPGYGNRAFACALMGLKYITIPTPEFQQAIDRGFADFVGLDYEPFSGQRVDMVVHDNNFKYTEVEPALQYANIANKIMVYVPRENRQELEKYNPRTIIQIKTRFYDTKGPNFQFLW